MKLVQYRFNNNIVDLRKIPASTVIQWPAPSDFTTIHFKGSHSSLDYLNGFRCSRTTRPAYTGCKFFHSCSVRPAFIDHLADSIPMANPLPIAELLLPASPSFIVCAISFARRQKPLRWFSKQPAGWIYHAVRRVID